MPLFLIVLTFKKLRTAFLDFSSCKSSFGKVRKSSHNQNSQEKNWGASHRQANMASLHALDRTAEGRAAVSIRVALGDASTKYPPAWDVCKHRSGQFSSCAGIYIFFQVSDHYQTAQ